MLKLSSQSGFALLEVVLAFVISVSVLGIALPALSQSVTKITEFRSYSFALALAHSKLKEFLIKCPDIISPAQHGMENGYYWSISQQQILPKIAGNSTSGVYSLNQINISVAAEENGLPLIKLSVHRLGELAHETEIKSPGY